MASAHLLRFHDVRDAYRLIGECRDLGADPQFWQTRLFEGVCQLLGVKATVGGEAFTSADHRMQIVAAYPVGLDERELRGFQLWNREVGINGCPIFQAIQKHPSISMTSARSELVTARDWYRSASYLVRTGTDHQMTSLRQLDDRSSFHAIAVHHSTGERDFSERQQQILGFLHDELVPHIGRTLVSHTEPSPVRLSPRLRQTLACLLEGDSEKQVAARLRLSLPTTHQYVTALYRHFRVRSRAQLLAHVIQRLSRGSWSVILKALGEAPEEQSEDV